MCAYVLVFLSSLLSFFAHENATPYPSEPQETLLHAYVRLHSVTFAMRSSCDSFLSHALVWCTAQIAIGTLEYLHLFACVRCGMLVLSLCLQFLLSPFCIDHSVTFRLSHAFNMVLLLYHIPFPPQLALLLAQSESSRLYLSQEMAAMRSELASLSAHAQTQHGGQADAADKELTLGMSMSSCCLPCSLG